MKESELIFGIRAVIEAVQAGKEVDKIMVKRDLQGELVKELFEILRGSGIPVQRVPAERLNRYTRKNHQGVIAFVSAISYYKLEDIVPAIYEQGKNPFIVLLDGVTDVRNFGAIARTCECAGVDALVIPSKGERDGQCRCDKDFRRCAPRPAGLQGTEHQRGYPLPAAVGREGLCCQRESLDALYPGRFPKPAGPRDGSRRYRRFAGEPPDMRRHGEDTAVRHHRLAECLRRFVDINL